MVEGIVTLDYDVGIGQPYPVMLSDARVVVN